MNEATRIRGCDVETTEMWVFARGVREDCIKQNDELFHKDVAF